VERNPSKPDQRRIQLSGGGLLTVRPVTPADVDGLVALYDGLSDDDRYSRFFSSYLPPRSFFHRLASVVERGGYGVVATMGGDGEAAGATRGTAPIVGEASYELLPNGDGELGMTVAADHRGWLGPYLLDALVDAARSRGVPNLEADVLATNRRMLGVPRARGYATMGSDDLTTLRLLVGTAGHVPTWPADPGTDQPDRPRVLVETPGGRWHAGAEAHAAGLQVIACSGPRCARPRCPVLAGQPCPLAAGADAIVVSSAPTTSAGAPSPMPTPISTPACRSASSPAPATARVSRTWQHSKMLAASSPSTTGTRVPSSTSSTGSRSSTSGLERNVTFGSNAE
jgi:hypothetical protein